MKNTDQFKNTECCAQYGARLVMKSVICPRRDGAAEEDGGHPRKIIIINMRSLQDGKGQFLANNCENLGIR